MSWSGDTSRIFLRRGPRELSRPLFPAIHLVSPSAAFPSHCPVSSPEISPSNIQPQSLTQRGSWLKCTIPTKGQAVLGAPDPILLLSLCFPRKHQKPPTLLGVGLPGASCSSSSWGWPVPMDTRRIAKVGENPSTCTRSQCPSHMSEGLSVIATWCTQLRHLSNLAQLPLCHDRGAIWPNF